MPGALQRTEMGTLIAGTFPSIRRDGRFGDPISVATTFSHNRSEAVFRRSTPKRFQARSVNALSDPDLSILLFEKIPDRAGEVRFHRCPGQFGIPRRNRIGNFVVEHHAFALFFRSRTPAPGLGNGDLHHFLE